MKKITAITTVLILFSITAFSQRLTADELILKSQCENFECFDDFVSAKGFSFYQAYDDSSYVMHFFMSNNYTDTIGAGDSTLNIKNNCSIVLYKDGMGTNVAFRTTNIEYYKMLLASFIAKGFIAEGTKQSDTGGELTDYVKSDSPQFLLTVSVDQLEKGGIHFTSYDFELEQDR